MSDLNQMQQNDEIDLQDLIKSIWAGKYILISVIMILVLWAGAYLFMFGNVKKVSIIAEPISVAEAGKYFDYNNALSFIDEYKRVDIENNISISPEILSRNFEDELKKRETLKSSLTQLGIIRQKNDETDVQFSERLEANALGYKFINPVMNKDVRTEPFKVNFVMKGENDQIIEFVDLWFASTNDRVKELVQTQYQNFNKGYLRLVNWQKQDIELKKSYLSSSYTFEQKQKIEYLKEQAEIAKALNLEGNALAAKMAQNVDLFSLIFDDRNLFYMRGYEAIEKEIALIEMREDITLHLPELVELEYEIDILNKDNTLERLQDIALTTPFYSDEFSSFSKEKTTIEIAPKYNPILVLILAAIFGGILGIFIILLRNAVAEKEEA